jgi:hypothetical protein
VLVEAAVAVDVITLVLTASAVVEAVAVLLYGGR